MRFSSLLFVALLSPFVSLKADSNIAKVHYRFGLSQGNRGNVVRLCNDQKTVRYIFEAWLDGSEIDSPDDQLGGSLCIRINRAGGRYIPGCLLCRPGTFRNYTPEGCQGIFSEAMLIKAYKQAQNHVPITFVGYGMVMTVLINRLSFFDQALRPGGDHKVRELQFDLDIHPDPAVPENQPFERRD